jgi:hypothetical protein
MKRKNTYWPLINADERGFELPGLVLVIRVHPRSSAAKFVLAFSWGRAET